MPTPLFELGLFLDDEPPSLLARAQIRRAGDNRRSAPEGNVDCLSPDGWHGRSLGLISEDADTLLGAIPRIRPRIDAWFVDYPSMLLSLTRKHRLCSHAGTGRLRGPRFPDDGFSRAL